MLTVLEAINRSVLIPHPETELLVETILDCFDKLKFYQLIE